MFSALPTGARRATFSQLLCWTLLLAALLLPLGAQQPSAGGTPLAAIRQLVWQAHYPEAERQLNAYLKVHPDDLQAHLLLGAADYAAGNYTGAEPELKAVLAQEPANREAVKLMGLDAFFLARPREAIPYLLQVRQWMPEQIDLQYLLATCYVQTGRLPEARAAAATMLGVPVTGASAHLALAKVLLRQQMEARALPEIEAALASDPRLPMAHFMLGEIATFNGHYQEARDAFAAEIAVNPTFALAFARLGDAEFRLNHIEQAKSALSRAIWLDPTVSDPYIVMGKLLLRQGDAALAERMLAHALTLDPNNYEAHYLRGRALEALQKKPEAQQEFALSQKLRPPVEGHVAMER